MGHFKNVFLQSITAKFEENNGKFLYFYSIGKLEIIPTIQ